MSNNSKSKKSLMEIQLMSPDSISLLVNFDKYRSWTLLVDGDPFLVETIDDYRFIHQVVSMWLFQLPYKSDLGSNQKPK